jgi:hypothetical protein
LWAPYVDSISIYFFEVDNYRSRQETEYFAWICKMLRVGVVFASWSGEENDPILSFWMILKPGLGMPHRNINIPSDASDNPTGKILGDKIKPVHFDDFDFKGGPIFIPKDAWDLDLASPLEVTQKELEELKAKGVKTFDRLADYVLEPQKAKVPKLSKNASDERPQEVKT